MGKTLLSNVSKGISQECLQSLYYFTAQQIFLKYVSTVYLLKYGETKILFTLGCME